MKSICLLPFVLASVMGSIPYGVPPSPGLLVHNTPIKALARPVISYTPQVTEVRPELRVIDNTYDVPVPRAVYDTKHVTPVHHRHVPEPYPVPQPYAVPQPYVVPQPYPVPVPVHEKVHVQHHVSPAPVHVTYGDAHVVEHGFDKVNEY